MSQILKLVQGVGGQKLRTGDGQDGLLAASDGAMAEAIVRLASDEALRARMTARARAVQPPVTWPGVLRRTEDLYGLAIERLDRAPDGRPERRVG